MAVFPSGSVLSYRMFSGWSFQPVVFYPQLFSGGIFSVAFYLGFPKTINFTLKTKNTEYKNTYHETLSKNNPRPSISAREFARQPKFRITGGDQSKVVYHTALYQEFRISPTLCRRPKTSG